MNAMHATVAFGKDAVCRVRSSAGDLRKNSFAGEILACVGEFQKSCLRKLKVLVVPPHCRVQVD